LVIAAALLACRPAAAGEAPADLTELSLEELMNVEVTTVSRKPERLATVGEAVYVLTGEDIRRSGATSIPEALRLVPGMQVARIDSNKWAIGVRGFASRLARSVLVLIDGRTVYNPLFAGTYWELQDTMLEDIDRIEVIRGPGGTLWGANAFNGVINIITKPAAETQGALVSAGAGNEERGFGGARYGGAIGKNLYYRAYGKYFNRDAGEGHQLGDYDDWWMGRGGFRIDWQPQESDALTLQGDLYDGELGNRVTIPQFNAPFARVLKKDSDVSGGNVLGRWTRAFSATSEASLQMYYDHTFRRDPNFREERNTVDIDAQHRFRLPWRQEIVWGLGYRGTADNTGGVPGVAFVPEDRVDHLHTAFLQDEIILVPDRLRLTAGIKLGHNDYSGFEYQPNLRLSWTPLAQHVLWVSFGRAVRTPSRLEHDAVITGVPINLDPADASQCQPPGAPCAYTRLLGDRRFDSEKLLAYQLGWRAQIASRLLLDTVVFYHDYADLLSLEPGAPFPEASPPPAHQVLPFDIANKVNGEAYGVTVAADVFLAEWWRLQASYTFLKIDLRRDPGSLDPITVASTEGSSPHHQALGFSQIDLPGGFEFDSIVRYVESLPAQNVRSYVTFDVRLGYQLTPNIELSAVGQNLSDTDHREFGGGTEVQRGAYGQVRWRW
jgi:iron complex outermembrane receptor protein